jgi:branched-chain amino acid aminotransferase
VDGVPRQARRAHASSLIVDIRAAVYFAGHQSSAAAARRREASEVLMSDIVVKQVEPGASRVKPSDESNLGFGRVFSNHFFLMDYDPKRGWHDPRIEPYRKLELDPATMVLHYGQEVFEGLKAYRGKDDGVYLFRYRDNLVRMQRSCARMKIPTFDEDVVADGLRQLVLLDRDWIPVAEGCALYIRPTVIAMDPFLGVRPSDTYLFYIITGPVGAYYPEGFNPVSIYVSDTYVRAVRGGTGEAKTGGNYAAGLAAQHEARSKGYSQVLWLDAVEHRYVEEVGTMNICFVIDGKVVTSPLDGTILHGVTRDSALRMCRDWGFEVDERPIPIDEVCAKARSGALTECFGTGTAAIISAVGSICYKGEVTTIGDGGTGTLSRRLYTTLLQMQRGFVDDPHGWVERIDL